MHNPALYITVHAYGPVSFFRDTDRLREIVTRLTEQHEAGLPEPWHVTDAPPEYIDGQLKAIVGIEMPIRRIEGKWKLSQNRTAEDRAGAVAALGASELAALMRGY